MIAPGRGLLRDVPLCGSVAPRNPRPGATRFLPRSGGPCPDDSACDGCVQPRRVCALSSVMRAPCVSKSAARRLGEKNLSSQHCAQPTRSRATDEAALRPRPPRPACPSRPRLRSAPLITRRIIFNNIYPQESFSKKSNSACYLTGGGGRAEKRVGSQPGGVREAYRVRPRRTWARSREARPTEKRVQPRTACARESPAASRERAVENGYARPRGVLTTAAHARNLHRCVNPGQRCCSALEYE